MADQFSLSADRWASENAPEFMRVRTAALANIARATTGIHAIARLLHNLIGDADDGVAVDFIDHFTKQRLAGAIECLSDFIYDIFESESFSSDQIRAIEEANHG